MFVCSHFSHAVSIGSSLQITWCPENHRQHFGGGSQGSSRDGISQGSILVRCQGGPLDCKTLGLCGKRKNKQLPNQTTPSLGTKMTIPKSNCLQPLFCLFSGKFVGSILVEFLWIDLGRVFGARFRLSFWVLELG